MRFIVAYRLKRKNARRKVELKFKADSITQARFKFDSMVSSWDISKKDYELLTGDWKHVMFYGDKVVILNGAAERSPDAPV